MRLPDQWINWTIDEQIGAGSYGTVYQASCEDKLAAIKIIDIPGNEGERAAIRRDYPDDDSFLHYCEDVCENLLEQITFWENIKDNPNIVRIDDAIAQQDPDSLTWHVYIRMELMEALPDYLLHHRITEDDILRIGLDICHALTYCEERQIIHRDIKPDNILISADGVAKLCDFGTARRVDLLCDTLSLKGSPNYMAPEIYHGEPYDFRADQYSLGLVLYQYLNDNHLPFINGNKQLINKKEREMALKARMSGEPLSAPCHASDKAAKVICKACAYDPKQRYTSISSLEEALKWSLGIINDTPPESEISNASPGNVSDLTKKKKGILTSVIITCAVLVTAGAVIARAYTVHHDNEVFVLSSDEKEQSNGNTAENTLSNPVITTDDPENDGQTTSWDCVYFGEYPQTEIVDAAETAGTYGKNWAAESDYIIDAELYSRLEAADYDENGDAVIDGTKYRRLSTDSEMLAFYYTYEEGDSADIVEEFYTWDTSVPYHYFRYEPIKWRVLDTDDESALLLSDIILDTKTYEDNHNYEAVTWENSDIRSWLNGKDDSGNSEQNESETLSFKDTAFTDTEQTALIELQISNDNNLQYGTSGGNDTLDQVFLLSETECRYSDYGFAEYTAKSDLSRTAESSTYAKATGVRCSNTGSASDVSSWWLRSPGVDLEPYRAQYTSEDGTVVSEGEDTEISDVGVRPVIRLNLSSDEWTDAGTVSSGQSHLEK